MTDYSGNYIYMDGALQFFSHPEGYVEPLAAAQKVKGFEIGVPGATYSSYKYVFQYKDHLGNVRLSYSDLDLNGAIDPQTEILDEKNYYPFGGEHKGYNSNINGTYHPYGFAGKEENDELGLEWMDFGARMYDKWLGRWHVTDNLSELYFSNSTYVYALNTPIQAIDPDGNIVIFINGNHFGDGATGYEGWRKGSSSYNWTGSNAYWRNGSSQFDTSVMNRLGDSRAIYRDGASGGTFGLASDDPIGINTARGRIRNGYAQGKRDAETIINNLARDKTTGEIIETIKIITHSMGGAYGKGYVRALKKYISTLPEEQQRQIRITLVADFDPLQAGSLSADPDIFTQQFTHKKGKGKKDSDGLGWLANEMQEGVDEYYESGTEARHSIFTFFDNISNLQEGTYSYNKKTKEWECTTCKD